MPHIDSIVHNGIVYSAQLYHWRQEYPTIGRWGFYLSASVFDAETKEPVKIKRISIMMGNHPNYFPGWKFDDERIFRENSNTHYIGPWYETQISEGSVGGYARFDLEDGTRLEIKDLRLEKPKADWSIPPIPIIKIPFSMENTLPSPSL